VPNEERIYLKANHRVALTITAPRWCPACTQRAFPLQDQCSGFGQGNDTLEAGTWLIIYTGSGQRLVTFLRGTQEPALVLYWGRPTVLFTDSRNSTNPRALRVDKRTAWSGAP